MIRASNIKKIGYKKWLKIGYKKWLKWLEMSIATLIPENNMRTVSVEHAHMKYGN